MFSASFSVAGRPCMDYFCQQSVSLRCEKYSRKLLDAVGPLQAVKLAFKVSVAIFVGFSQVFL